MKVTLPMVAAACFIVAFLAFSLSLATVTGTVIVNATAIPMQGGQAVAVDRLNSSVVGVAKVRPFFNAIRNNRVDVVGIGDSNEGFYLVGWDEGYQYALSLRYPMYATGLVSLNEAKGNNTLMGYRYHRAEVIQPIGLWYGAPASLDRYFGVGNDTYELQPLNYAYLAENQTYTQWYQHGFRIDQACPLNVQDPLRFHLVYGTFANGNSTFRPLIRNDQNGVTLVRENTSVSAITGVEGNLLEYTLDLPAAPRFYPLNFRLIANSNEHLDGPFFGAYYRAENLARSNGTSFTTLLFAGGYTARKMAMALRAADPAYLTDFFGRIRQLQGPEKHVLVRISAGMNDRQEVLPGIKTGAMPGWSPAAFKENVQDIIDSVNQVWVANGWNQSELYFVIAVSHDVPPYFQDAAKLDAFRPMADEISNENVRTASVNLKRIAPWTEMLANQWYHTINNQTNYPHLAQTGYYTISDREVRALTGR